MKCIPQTFLCCLPLKAGALVVGIETLCLLILSAIGLIYNVAVISKCDSCDFLAWRNCHAYSITGCIYILVMIALNLWFFYGIRKENASVVLTWIVVMGLWLGLVFVLLIVLICLYFKDNKNLTANIVTLICGLIVIAILLYEFIVTVAYWLELKNIKPPQAQGTA